MSHGNRTTARRRKSFSDQAHEAKSRYERPERVSEFPGTGEPMQGIEVREGEWASITELIEQRDKEGSEQ